MEGHSRSEIKKRAGLKIPDKTILIFVTQLRWIFIAKRLTIHGPGWRTDFYFEHPKMHIEPQLNPIIVEINAPK